MVLGSTGWRLASASSCLAGGNDRKGISLKRSSATVLVYFFLLPLSPLSGSKQPSCSLAKKRSQSRKYGQAISMASKAWAQSFLKASHVLRQGLIILSLRQGEAITEQPTRRISGEHSPLSRPWMTLSRRYSGPDSASVRVRCPRMLGNIVLERLHLIEDGTFIIH